MRHTYTTRLLYTVVPSENFAPKNKTVDLLLETLVSDINKLQEEGIEAINFLFTFQSPELVPYSTSQQKSNEFGGVKSFGFLLVGD